MRKILASFLVCLISMTSASIANDVINASNTVHILYYDNIEYQEDPYQFARGLALEDFQNHLKFFQSEEYDIVSLNDALHLPTGSKGKKISIILNAHDTEAIRHALPLLKRYGYPVEFVVKPSDFTKENIKLDTITKPLLNIINTTEEIDLTAKILNDETSRFRDYFNNSPPTLFLTNSAAYYNNTELLKPYAFDYILVPDGEAFMRRPDASTRPKVPYIAVQPSFSNLDVLGSYLNRRALPYTNFTRHQNGSDAIKTSWGFNAPATFKPHLKRLKCINHNNKNVDYVIINNRIEIRYSPINKSGNDTVQCTLPILYKNSNKTDTYYYIALHAPIKKAANSQ